MPSTRTLTWRFVGLAAVAALFLVTVGEARAQYWLRPAAPATSGTYGPRMSFGEFGARLNRGYAYGSPYGGLGAINYGFGYGFGPGYPPGGSILYGSAYNYPSPKPALSGYYPPFASYGAAWQNPAVFPSPSPNTGIAAPRYQVVPRWRVR